MSQRDCLQVFEQYRAGQEGPEALLGCLRDEGARWLAAHARDLSSHDHEDLLQAALETLLSTLPRFRGDAYPMVRAYFLAILRSRLADHFRRQRREVVGLPPGSPDSPGQDSTDVESPVDLRVDLSRLLSPQEYRVVRLKLEGFGDREVARILHKAPGTVASLYHRARQKIRKNLLGTL